MLYILRCIYTFRNIVRINQTCNNPTSPHLATNELKFPKKHSVEETQAAAKPVKATFSQVSMYPSIKHHSTTI